MGIETTADATAKRRRSRKAELAVAYHEAGHVVARLRLGLRFRYVTIEPKDGSEGHVKTCGFPRRYQDALEYGDITPKMRDTIEKEIIDHIAGYLCQRFVSNRISHHAWQSDRHWATTFANMMCGSKRQHQAYCDYLFIRAEDFVARPGLREEVDAVAQALIERRTITYDDCCSLLMELAQARFAPSFVIAGLDNSDTMVAADTDPST